MNLANNYIHNIKIGNTQVEKAILNGEVLFDSTVVHGDLLHATTAFDQTFVVPDNIYSVTVKIQGAGGSGSSAGNSTGTARAGGGKAGQYVEYTIDVLPRQTFVMAVGKGGVGVASVDAQGNIGEPSSFGAYSADGGAGGVVSTSYGTPAHFGQGANHAASPYNGLVYHDGLMNSSAYGGEASSKWHGGDGNRYDSPQGPIGGSSGSGGGALMELGFGRVSGNGGDGFVHVYW